MSSPNSIVYAHGSPYRHPSSHPNVPPSPPVCLPRTHSPSRLSSWLYARYVAQNVVCRSTFNARHLTPPLPSPGHNSLGPRPSRELPRPPTTRLCHSLSLPHYPPPSSIDAWIDKCQSAYLIPLSLTVGTQPSLLPPLSRTYAQSKLIRVRCAMV